MSCKKSFKHIKNALSVLTVSLLGCAGIVFAVLYIETFSNGFVAEYSTVLITVSSAIITVLTMLAIMFIGKTSGILHKLFFITVFLIASVLAALYILKISGFLDKIDSVEDLRSYIASYGSYAALAFILIQFLQVVVLPIPAFITVGAGVLLFGPFYGAIYSCTGIILGSLVAFFIGRLFGVKVARWLVGQENLEKGLKTIKGKDKIVLTFMFLFPFFPDDILCFVAGITTVSPLFFVIMIFITRIISVFASSYSMNNSIIPYDTWWGILLWIIFFIITILLTVLIYKKGDKIEKQFSNFLGKKKNKKSTND